MNALRIVCEALGALVLLSWAIIALAFVLAGLRLRAERRALSVCRSCGEPQQGGHCANCAPVIRAEDLATWTPRISDAETVEVPLASLEKR